MWTRWLSLTFCLIFAMCSLSYGQSKENAPAAPTVPPLADDELREVIKRLYDLGSAWAELDVYKQAIGQVNYMMVRERELFGRMIESEKAKTELAQRERDQAIKERDFFEAQLKAITKKPGFGCKLKKVFTLGLARCG